MFDQRAVPVKYMLFDWGGLAVLKAFGAMLLPPCRDEVGGVEALRCFPNSPVCLVHISISVYDSQSPLIFTLSEASKYALRSNVTTSFGTDQLRRSQKTPLFFERDEDDLHYF